MVLFLGLQKRTAHGGGQPNQLALVDMECSVSEVSDPELTSHVGAGGQGLAGIKSSSTFTTTSQHAAVPLATSRIGSQVPSAVTKLIRGCKLEVCSLML